MRTLSVKANLPEDLWLEAMMTTNYLRNRTFHSRVKDVPFKIWYGKKPNLKFLKRFGCVAYLHVPPQRRKSKFDARAQKGVFVGYGFSTAGYRVWIPNEDKIYESKHVTFDEAQLACKKEGHTIATEFDDDEDLPASQPVDDLDKTSVEESKAGPSTDPDSIIDRDSPGGEERKISQLPTSDPNQATFYRQVSRREKGQSKGKVDIYVYTPDGKVLRSKKDMVDYCMKNHILINMDSLKNMFSAKNPFVGNLYCEKIEESEASEYQDFEETPEESCCAEVQIPRSPGEAYKLPEAESWRGAMKEELQTMEERGVWTPMPKPTEGRVIGTKWVYTIKRKTNNQIRYKARLVALGNNQKEGMDYDETYSPVVNFTLIRLFVALFICAMDWCHSLLDVKCAYLYGDLDHNIYIKKPAGYFKKEIQHGEVLKLNKALYGLHQSGKCWFEELHNKLISNGFEEILGLTCVYAFEKSAVLLVYVDDLAIFSKDQTTHQKVISQIKSFYQVEDLGPISKLLGIEFNINGRSACISCPQYIEKCIKKFNLKNNNNVYLPIQPGIVSSRSEQPTDPDVIAKMQNVPYRNLLGCLLYISGRCRPDISYSVASLTQVVENPSPIHWKRLTQILQYLYTTKNEGLKMRPQDLPVQLQVYADASWASDPDYRRSWSGYGIFLNSSPVTWRVVKQSCVALSPMEAEFIATSEAVKDLKYLKTTLTQIFNKFSITPTIQKPILLCDNAAAIQYIKYRSENIRNRYIDLRYMFVREGHENGEFDVCHVKSADNLADILTKALNKFIFNKLKVAYIQ